MQSEKKSGLDNGRQHISLKGQTRLFLAQGARPDPSLRGRDVLPVLPLNDRTILTGSTKERRLPFP